MLKANQIKNESPIRDLFLQYFVRELLRNALKEEPVIKNDSIEITLTQSSPEMNPSMATPKEKINPPLQMPKRKILARTIMPRNMPKQNFPSSILPPRKLNTYSASPQNRPMQLLPIPQAGPATETKGNINFGKLSQVLTDPAVLSIEVPGPGKYVLVNRSGRIEMSSMTLSKQEIDSVIEDISEKTKIPVLPGIFKTALSNFLITAVVSDFVGTRFIIQKRNQFNSPVQQEQNHSNSGFNNFHNGWQG